MAMARRKGRGPCFASALGDKGGARTFVYALSKYRFGDSPLLKLNSGLEFYGLFNIVVLVLEE